MKVKEFRAILEKKDLDIALFYNSDSSKFNPNMFYFSGYRGIGALIVPQNKNPFLIVPEMEFEKAKKSIVKRVYSMEKNRFFESLHKVCRKNRLKTKNIGVDNNNFTLNSYRHFKKQFKIRENQRFSGHRKSKGFSRETKTKDISLDCSKLREIKTENEIRNLRKSCNFADRIIQKAIQNFKDFKTESEAAAFLEYETKKLGLEASFNPIVASGSNGSMPHHEPSNTKIKNGFCVIDFGVKYKGYCSDITRTIYIGSPNKEENRLYNMLLTIQKNTISQLKENKRCSELYDFASKNLGKYKRNFVHGLGHGVGVEIHELPNLTLNSKDRIKNNMAFTIEPGIYFPGKFGIRIEDTVLFKDDVQVLTMTSKEFACRKA